MENNSSPYIYEKPLRSKNSKLNRSLAAVGLVAIGTVIGGSAFASSVINEAVADTGAQLTDPVISSTTPVPVEDVSNLTETANPVAGATVDTVLVSPVDPIIAIPLEQAQPKKNTAALQLPALTSGSFGNTSSATPYASTGTGGATKGATGSNFSSGAFPEREHKSEAHESQAYESEHEDDEQDDD